MPTTTNESVPGAAQGANSGTPNTTNVAQTSRREAVGVEIPVVIHASRSSASVKGIAKPLPAVHEETRTVIVFLHGAVVRLTAELTSGELIVLTNQKSGADVLCRVANVKTQPGIQNYVDLEFTQRAPGFWGDCFQSEHPGAPPATASNTIVPSPPTKPAAPQPVATPAGVLTGFPAVVPTPAPQPIAPSRVAVEEIVPAIIPQSPPTAPAEQHEVAGTIFGAALPQSQRAQSTGAQLQTEDSTGDSTGPKKTLLIAIAAVVLLGVMVGSYMLLRGRAAGRVPQPTAAVQNAPAQQPGEAPAAPSSSQASVSVVVTPQPGTPGGAAIQPAVISSGTVPAANQPSAVAPTPKLAAPPKILGRIAQPLAKSAIASSAEPPPMLPAGANGSGLEGSLFASTEPASGPSLPKPPVAERAAGGHFEEPILISSPPPAYPAAARTQHIQGDVVIDALVDGTGHVTVVKPLSGNGFLQQAALEAVRGWIYKPAHLDGEPRATHIQVKITFRLP